MLHSSGCTPCYQITILILLTVNFAKLFCRQPIKNEKPVTAYIIREMVDKCATAQCSLKDLRTATFCALEFASFFRVDELRAIQPNQITFRYEIKVPRSKTDVYREGNVVYISWFRTKYCPAELLLRYMSAAVIDTSCSLPFFRMLTFHKTTNSYALRSSGLSYSSFREAFNSALKSLGYDAREYGLHSLRSGGVSQNVHNRKKDASERFLKLHGLCQGHVCSGDSGGKIQGYAMLRALDCSFKWMLLYSIATCKDIVKALLAALRYCKIASSIKP